MIAFSLLKGIIAVILVTFGEIRPQFSVSNISQNYLTINDALIGQLSTKYTNLIFS